MHNGKYTRENKLRYISIPYYISIFKNKLCIAYYNIMILLLYSSVSQMFAFAMQHRYIHIIQHNLRPIHTFKKTIIMLLFPTNAPHTFNANKILYYNIILRFSKIGYSLVTNCDDTSILK